MHSHRGTILLILLFGCAAIARAQLVNLSVKGMAIDKVFTLIEQQSGYSFIYTGEMIAQAKPVTVSLQGVSLNEALRVCFADQPLQYSIDDKHILVRLKTVVATPVDRVVRGRVRNAEGEGIAGVSVGVKGTTIITATNVRGEFILERVPDNAVLIVSGAEMERQEIILGSRNYIDVTLKQHENVLDETVVIAYGTTSRRLNTGSVATVSSKDIERQAASNPLAALQGRVAGMEVIQKGGVPGSSFFIQIRGRSSLTQGIEPLIIVDGIPFAQGNTSLSQLRSSAASGISPLNVINPSDIERIEVLKDADATAIYGSRGANGVIIITTKRAQSGKLTVTVDIRNGFSTSHNRTKMLSLSDYLLVRREAFANDGIVPTPANAPDLFTWDSTKATDFVKLFTGGTGHNYDAQVGVSGGSELVKFSLNTGYHKDEGLLTTDQSLNRITLHTTLSYASQNKKLTSSIALDYANMRSNLLDRDMTYYINTPQHFPLYDSLGNLNWLSGNTPFAYIGLQNPLADLLNKYKGQFQNVAGNILLNYKVADALQFRVGAGFQGMNGDEITIVPKAASDPAIGMLSGANFANSLLRSWQVEPQLDYTLTKGASHFHVLAGATWQERMNKGTYVSAANYTNDLLLESMAAAGRLTAYDNFSQYRYTAGFARLSYDWKQTVLFNATGRRDGSSRFGPGRRFANFGAAGAGWIFTNMKLFNPIQSILSFGKLRASYGVTGNDQVGDYKFTDSWTPSFTYQGTAGLQPSRLYNPDYGWERNVKFEAALELGLFRNRLLVTSAYYRNRSSNQLVNYVLPIQAGFNSVQQNFDAVFDNTGWEFTVSKRSFNNKGLQWQSNFNVSVSQNKLIRFPGLANTSYKTLYEVGQPVTLVSLYNYTGIDPATGVYTFSDENGDGILNTTDKTARVNTAPQFFGGWQNDFTYGHFSFGVFLEFRKQQGLNYLSTQSSFMPGYFYTNHPSIVLDRWMKPGDDHTAVQRYTTNPSSTAFVNANSYLPFSNAIYSDASYIRVKNVSLSYTLPGWLLSKAKVLRAEVYAQAQNLFVITKFKFADPENQNIYVMPPLKAMVGGVRVVF